MKQALLIILALAAIAGAFFIGTLVFAWFYDISRQEASLGGFLAALGVFIAEILIFGSYLQQKGK
ncbi:hypothetical protein VVR12_01750 [Rothia sp. LK2588]|uniref:hypothetical protein n=1 Tax=Rothia sp. LK2588 TaxID=3114369 RepID=UPI0034CEF55A